MAEELLVVLNRKDPSCGLGFSLLGTPGLPPIIYDIVENSPAAESGKVEAGDVILKVNDTDVNRFNTKEVLKCLRLSENPVSLKLKRDPVVKAKVRNYLSSQNQYSGEHQHQHEMISMEPPQNNGGACPPPLARHPPSLEDVTRSNGDEHFKSQPRCEAFLMTGDRLLKLSRTAQSSILPKQKKIDSLHHNLHNNHHNNHQKHNSVPTSPIESERHHHGKTTSSAGTSPTPSVATSTAPTSSSYVVRTSRSEDHLQFTKDTSMSAVSIDIDDDITSSLNTLLDTRPDSEAEDPRVIWTYNTPHTDSSSSRTATTMSSEENASPRHSHSLSPASPTSVSSSVMSSDSSHSNSHSDPQKPPHSHLGPATDLSQSEAISNISSPDFQEENCEILNARDLVMEVSDPSDSDSTLLLSETTAKVRRSTTTNNGTTTTATTHNGITNNNNTQTLPKDQNSQNDYRIVIQVKGPDKEALGTQNRLHQNFRTPTREEPSGNVAEHSGYQALREVDDDGLQQLSEGAAILARAISPPPAPFHEDESDVESLHSFHYSPKAVDIPSAVRLAKRLFTLDGFKKSDVSRHLSKNNDFSRAVAEEYLKYFEFKGDSLDLALRKFLKQFSLSGETQERERVLVHFSKRYLDCNPGSFNSQDAVHTLTCAIMLLNTDLHGQGIGHKMTCSEFIENLSELNDGENFPRDILKSLYQAIKSYPLEWAMDEEAEDQEGQVKTSGGGGGVGVTDRELPGGGGCGVISTGKGFFDVPASAPAIEYKKGYVMRKSCIEPNGKKTPLGKRGWKMFYCTLRDLVLYLHKDEHGFRKTQLSDNLHNAIRIHHSLATKATDYTKKLHVFRLETADQAEYLFQTSDSKELQSWIDTINFVCASFSAPPLPGAVGSQKKFQRPLLPCSHTKLNLREQLRDHEERVQRLESELDVHRKHPPERGAKALVIQNYKEKDAYLHYELKRYKTYAYLLRSRISQYPELEGSLVDLSIGEAVEGDEEDAVSSPMTNRIKKDSKKS